MPDASRTVVGGLITFKRFSEGLSKVPTRWRKIFECNFNRKPKTTKLCVFLDVTVAQLIAIASDRRAAWLTAVAAHIAKANCRAAFVFAMKSLQPPS